jgi:hypothetical protein
MPKNPSKYTKLRECLEHEQEFTVSVGNSTYEKPRLLFTFKDGTEFFLYMDPKDMKVIANWANDYCLFGPEVK